MELWLFKLKCGQYFFVFFYCRDIRFISYPSSLLALHTYNRITNKASVEWEYVASNPLTLYIKMVYLNSKL